MWNVELKPEVAKDLKDPERFKKGINYAFSGILIVMTGVAFMFKLGQSRDRVTRLRTDKINAITRGLQLIEQRPPVTSGRTDPVGNAVTQRKHAKIRYLGREVRR